MHSYYITSVLRRGEDIHAHICIHNETHKHMNTHTHTSIHTHSHTHIYRERKNTSKRPYKNTKRGLKGCFPIHGMSKMAEISISHEKAWKCSL